MAELISDTEAHVREQWFELLRQMTLAQRLNRAVELSNAVREMFLANLQHLDETEQRRQLARACYGEEAVERIFGK